MTEQEWLASEDPAAMLDYLQASFRGGTLTPLDDSEYHRKLRLFACACAIACHGLAHALDMNKGGYSVWYETGEADPNDPEDTDRSPLYLASSWCRPQSNQIGVEDAITQGAKAALLREVVGDPFRPYGYVNATERRTSPPTPGDTVIWDEWLTPQVLSLAQAAYDDRLPDGTLDPVRLSILADALEDAGCRHVDLLAHLRSPGSHVRGCWALDLILGRQ